MSGEACLREQAVQLIDAPGIQLQLRRQRELVNSCVAEQRERYGAHNWNAVFEIRDDIGVTARKDELATNLTRKLLAYALCRQLEGYDEIVVDQLVGTLAKDDYRMQTLISGVVTSYPFVNHRIQEPVATTSNGK